MAIVAVSIAPSGEGVSLSRHVTAALRVLEGQDRVRWKLDSMFTTLEGDVDEIFALIRQMQEAVFAEGALRVGTVIKMATLYGDSIGIGRSHLIGAIVLVQFVGIPFAFLFGSLAGRIGSKRGIMLGLWVYVFISAFAYFMTQAWHFWVLAVVIAMVQGGTQALTRSLFASMVPRSRSSEFFGFFSVSSKFAGIIGPLLFGVVVQMTGESRLAIGSLVIF